MSPAYKLTRQHRRRLVRDMQADPGIAQAWQLHKALNTTITKPLGKSGRLWLAWRHYKIERNSPEPRPRSEAWTLAKKWAERVGK